MAGSRHRTHVVTLIDYIGLGGGAKEFGGAEAVAVSLTTRLDPERFRRTMVLYGRSEDPEDRREQEAMAGRLRAGGVEVIQLPRRSRYDLAAWRPLLRLLRTDALAATASMRGTLGGLLSFAGAQTLTAEQKTQGCTNLGVGEPETDFVTVFNTGLQ